MSVNVCGSMAEKARMSCSDAFDSVGAERGGSVAIWEGNLWWIEMEPRKGCCSEFQKVGKKGAVERWDQSRAQITTITDSRIKPISSDFLRCCLDWFLILAVCCCLFCAGYGKVEEGFDREEAKGFFDVPGGKEEEEKTERG